MPKTNTRVHKGYTRGTQRIHKGYIRGTQGIQKGTQGCTRVHKGTQEDTKWPAGWNFLGLKFDSYTKSIFLVHCLGIQKYALRFWGPLVPCPALYPAELMTVPDFLWAKYQVNRRPSIFLYTWYKIAFLKNSEYFLFSFWKWLLFLSFSKSAVHLIGDALNLNVSCIFGTDSPVFFMLDLQKSVLRSISNMDVVNIKVMKS